jgi:uncharacterized caspase-like protein
MDLAIKEFRVSIKNSDVGLFFFAGHGIQINGENYLPPVPERSGDLKHCRASF